MISLMQNLGTPMKRDQTSILIRGGQALHQKMMASAKKQQKSLNELCCDRLSIPSSLENGAFALIRKVVAAADATFAADLVGVVLYGSRARSEARDDSDWDFLLVMDNTLPLNRELYRRWDHDFPSPDHPLEIHFAHIPASTRGATGFWAEIALDGIILYEQAFAVSRHLIAVRHDIAEGLIIRKKSHGQTYWIYKEVA